MYVNIFLQLSVYVATLCLKKCHTPLNIFIVEIELSLRKQNDIVFNGNLKELC